ncbi:MAG: UDP-N-acetylmuramoylalanine--D-glutamate ligase [Actinomycetota bacterium]
MKALVFGLGIAGTAVARALAARGIEPVLVDDNDDQAHVTLAAELGASLTIAPDLGTLSSLVKEVEFVMPAPGVAESHPLFTVANDLGRESLSEIELAYRWEQERVGGPRPMIGITGTDGKTTTTLLAAAMIRESGRRVAAVGNTETPLIAALDEEVDAFVVECSSFRLALTRDFRVEAGAWLNLAPDHLDWHRDMASYRSSKARIWAAATATDVAVAPSADPSIVAAARATRAKVVTFGFGDGDLYACRDGRLIATGSEIIGSDEMPRALPHDITNSLAAAATVLESGIGSMKGVAAALATFRPSHHRIEFVAESAGVSWFDDSKATSPHAVATALRAFPSIVLIAGGRNKGLDLAGIARVGTSVKAVVGIGESGAEVVSHFGGRCPSATADSMAEAVERAATFASAGDVVLLSPGCTSFDWYRNYEERGRDFARLVREHVAETIADAIGEGGHQ